jgi:hypothetical protein
MQQFMMPAPTSQRSIADCFNEQRVRSEIRHTGRRGRSQSQ